MKRTKESAIKEYQAIRKRHGDRAKSSGWIIKSGYGYLAKIARKYLGGWNAFKKISGFSDKPLRESWTKDFAIKTYQDIRKKHGDKAKSNNYIRKIGGNKLVGYVAGNFDNWNVFKTQAGFNDEPLITNWTITMAIKKYKTIRNRYGNKAGSCGWMENNGYRNLARYGYESCGGWVRFKKRAGFKDNPIYNFWTKEIAIKKYQDIREKYGDKTKSSDWMNRRHNHLMQWIRCNFNGWNDFKKKSGFYEDPLRRSWTKAEAIRKYCDIRKKNGNMAKGTEWMNRNRYSGLVVYARNNFNGWNNFKRHAGFNEGLPCKSWSIDLAIKTYASAVKKHGIKTRNSNWMKKNGYGSLVYFIGYFKGFGSWTKFLDFYNFSYKMDDKEFRINI